MWELFVFTDQNKAEGKKLKVHESEFLDCVRMNGFDGQFYTAIHTDGNGNKTIINIGMSHKQSKEMERNKRLAELFDKMSEEMKGYEKPKPKKSWLAKIWPFCFAFVLFSCQPNPEIELQKVEIEKLQIAVSDLTIASIKHRRGIDSLSVQNELLFQTVAKHDSAINERQFKRDRAERRGLFWGGVAKSVIGK